MSDTIEHGSEGEDGGHAHADPAWDRALGYEEGQPAKDYKERGRDVGLDEMVAKNTCEGDLHDEARISDIIAYSLVVVMEINIEHELIKMDRSIDLRI